MWDAHLVGAAPIIGGHRGRAAVPYPTPERRHQRSDPP